MVADWHHQGQQSLRFLGLLLLVVAADLSATLLLLDVLTELLIELPWPQQNVA